MYVYKTTNLINGKIYIGISKKRSINNTSYLGSGKALKKAIVKYGRENFLKEILIEDDSFKYPDIQKLEIEFIKTMNSTNPKIGYNISQGGDGNSGEANGMYGKNHKDSTRRKISKSRLLKLNEDPLYGKKSLEAKKRWRKIISKRNTVNPTLPNGHSEESKAKISKRISEMLATGELVRNYAAFSDERKQEYSEMFKGENNPFYGRTHSEEAKNKIRERIRSKLPGVKMFSIENVLLKEYENIQDAKADGYRIDQIRLVAEGKNKTHKGYKWEYINQ